MKVSKLDDKKRIPVVLFSQMNSNNKSLLLSLFMFGHSVRYYSPFISPNQLQLLAQGFRTFLATSSRKRTKQSFGRQDVQKFQGISLPPFPYLSRRSTFFLFGFQQILLEAYKSGICALLYLILEFSIKKQKFQKWLVIKK